MSKFTSILKTLEESQQIKELSSKTLGSYAKKGPSVYLNGKSVVHKQKKSLHPTTGKIVSESSSVQEYLTFMNTLDESQIEMFIQLLDEDTFQMIKESQSLSEAAPKDNKKIRETELDSYRKMGKEHHDSGGNAVPSSDVALMDKLDKASPEVGGADHLGLKSTHKMKAWGEGWHGARANRKEVTESVNESTMDAYAKFLSPNK